MGMLLEEVLLFLLTASGYRTVNWSIDPPDPTLYRNTPTSALFVCGRGSKHQIDAIADYRIAHPFSYPQRLLVEAKFYQEPVGIEVIRNAVGVLKDVCELWVTGKSNELVRQRYHYQYAVFSPSGYSISAQQYAFVHDVYLIPLAHSAFIQPITRQIKQIGHIAYAKEQGQRRLQPSSRRGLNELRQAVRREMQGARSENTLALNQLIQDEELQNSFNELFQLSRRLRNAPLAMIGGRFPVFLVPAPGLSWARLRNEVRVRIKWDDRSWYLEKAGSGEQLFSFDLPIELFRQYEEKGMLAPNRALDLKEETMAEMQVVVIQNNFPRIITFHLDTDWLQRLREEVPFNQYTSNW
jgi:hypothetical protein